MPAMTQNQYQNVLTKPLARQRGHKTYLNLCGLNPSHAREVKKYKSSCVDQTNPMPERTQNASQPVLPKPFPCQRGQNVSQHVLTNPIPCLGGHKMHLNLWWPNLSHVSGDTTYISPSHASEDTTCISSCVDRTPHMPTRTKNASELVMTKTHHKSARTNIYLNLCYPNHSHDSNETNCIRTCID